VGNDLLAAVIDICRREKVSSLHGFCSEDSELRPLLAAAGFRPRERNARVVTYAKPETQCGRLLQSGMHFAFSQVEVML